MSKKGSNPDPTFKKPTPPPPPPKKENQSIDWSKIKCPADYGHYTTHRE